MNIGLIADDARKMLMQNLCIAYKGILSKNDLYTTGVTGRVIEEATNQISSWLLYVMKEVFFQQRA